MDVAKLFDLAGRLPAAADLLLQGAAFVAAVRDNAALASHILSDGEWVELDGVHARALAAADTLDGKLASAEKR